MYTDEDMEDAFDDMIAEEEEHYNPLLVKVTTGSMGLFDDGETVYEDVMIFYPSPVDPVIRRVDQLSVDVGQIIGLEGIQYFDEVFKDNTVRRYERVGW